MYIFIVDVKQDSLSKNAGLAGIISTSNSITNLIYKEITDEDGNIEKRRILEKNKLLLISEDSFKISDNICNDFDIVLIPDDPENDIYPECIFTTQSHICTHQGGVKIPKDKESRIIRYDQHLKGGGGGYAILAELLAAYNNGFDKNKYDKALESIKAWFKPDREKEIRDAIDSFYSTFCK